MKVVGAMDRHITKDPAKLVHGMRIHPVEEPVIEVLTDISSC
jgi:hypothetical protein